VSRDKFEITLDSLKDGPSRTSELIHNDGKHSEWYEWRDNNWVRIEPVTLAPLELPAPRRLLHYILFALTLFAILLFVWMAA